MKTDAEKQQKDFAKQKEEFEKRFAGVDLNGKNVVFLVDISGSMDYLNFEDFLARKRAPGKWDEVCKTVRSVMSSLPKLEKFQILIFSDNATYLLGNEGKWIDYDPKRDRELPDRVLAALQKTKPEGGTNLHDAMEKAFKFRDQGLDTIYLFSDGLPNIGPGLTQAEEKEAQKQDARRTAAGLRAGENIRNPRIGDDLRKQLKTKWNPATGGKQRVRVHSIGFFFDSDNLGSTLWTLSRENEGSFVGMSKP
jgi:hypothetical protein